MKRDFLNSIQAKDPVSKRQSVKAAVKKLWKSYQRTDLEERLTNVSGDLDRHLPTTFQMETRHQLEHIAAEAKKAYKTLYFHRVHQYLKERLKYV